MALDLPDHELVTPAGADMLWGDGFEVEALINCRFAGAALTITEVPSVERERLRGRSNLRTVSDGMRVLRTLRTERARLRRNLAFDAALLGQTPRRSGTIAWCPPRPVSMRFAHTLHSHRGVAVAR